MSSDLGHLDNVWQQVAKSVTADNSSLRFARVYKPAPGVPEVPFVAVYMEDFANEKVFNVGLKIRCVAYVCYLERKISFSFSLCVCAVFWLYLIEYISIISTL